MRAFFLGTPAAAVPALRALVGSRHAVVGVACQPDRPAHRGRHVVAPPVKEVALSLGIDVVQPESIATVAARREVEERRPDVLVVVAYGRILGPRFLALAPRGGVNLHFSLLPRWRGAAPVQHALLAGDRRTGVTTMQVAAVLDAGPVFLQEETPIEEGEHAPSLEARLADTGARLLVRTLDGIEDGVLTSRPQDEAAVTLAPPLAKALGDLDPTRAADELLRRVCAFDPWPGCVLRFARTAVAVLDAAVDAAGVDAPPGTVLAPRGEALPVACGGGTVLLLRRVRPAGRGAMSGQALVSGRHVAVGERAEPPPA